MNSITVPVPEPRVPMEPPSPGRVDKDAMVQEVLQMYFVERLSMRKIATILGVSHMSVYRMLSDPNVEILI